ncbi:hypothetical protein A4A49_53789 [Nicotiana attenuata]|uniref:Uncharacterized protein n=1 Tax=Nicotiana attenuata TaxID=49451 RepID=A0A1J6IKS9_NICAT|nr:hypothetical protein A4A49_53789 [Nicotiana attenuata]
MVESEVKKSLIAYSKKFSHTKKGFDSDLLFYDNLVDEYVSNLGYIGVQQLIVNGPFGTYYEIEGDYGIMTLLDFVNNQFNVIDIFVVEESATDCDESDNCDDNEYVFSLDYDSDKLEKLFTQKKRDINDKLTDYKELDRSMTFKDIAEARKLINMYALANGNGLEQLKSDLTRLRTLNFEHTYEPAYENYRVNAKTIATYFKRWLQDDPKIKVREIRASLKATFNVNVSEAKCKRAKRLILESLEGSFTDKYNKLVEYVNELKFSNPGSDVVVNLSKDALVEGKRRFLRMYIYFHAIKIGFKSGLRPFIGLDGTFLKGKVLAQVKVSFEPSLVCIEMGRFEHVGCT